MDLTYYLTYKYGEFTIGCINKHIFPFCCIILVIIFTKNDIIFDDMTKVSFLKKHFLCVLSVIIRGSAWIAVPCRLNVLAPCAVTDIF